MSFNSPIFQNCIRVIKRPVCIVTAEESNVEEGWVYPDIGLMIIGGFTGTIFDWNAENIPHVTRSISIDSKLSIDKGSASYPESSPTGSVLSKYKDEIVSAVAGLDLLFILVDQDELSGSGILLAVADVIRETGIPTIAVAIAALTAEGERHRQTALAEYRALSQSSNAYFLIPRDLPGRLLDQGASIADVQQAPLTIFGQIYRSIVLPSTEQGWVGIDFQDVMTVFTKYNGMTYFGIGSATGEHAEEVALNMAINSPSLGGKLLAQANAVLVTIEGRPDIIKMGHIESIMEGVNAFCPDIDVMYGAYTITELATDYRITIIANDISML